MSNEQFSVLIGVPAFGILLDALPFQSLNARMFLIESRMLNFENTFTSRFDLLMGRLTDVDKEIHRQ